MTAIRLRLLQYNVGSHSRQGDVVKQQLVQTALQQGLCDAARAHGCTGIHEPVRPGVGALYQAATGLCCLVAALIAKLVPCFAILLTDSESGSFLAQQKTCPDFAHSIVLVQETNISTSFIAMLLPRRHAQTQHQT
ncbi:hypothetical protein ABBQ38_002784 [Trebouxia sp. C0009 RCD-2024]